MAPVARRLEGAFQVLEPFQRGSGPEPLTVARHVADLLEVIDDGCREPSPILVGHSWGAMLALAFAAAHPKRTARIALIGCGTFDPAARARMFELLEGRKTTRWRRRMQRLDSVRSPDASMMARGALVNELQSVELLPAEPDDHSEVDARAHRQTWDDMMRLQSEGVYPTAFAAFRGPVVMIHGDQDPHPGHMIRDSLAGVLPQLEYLELERCGHYPWRERAAVEAFYGHLLAWLGAAT
jgi:pimeloyl-ACP methyl ester carboxylesterase